MKYFGNEVPGSESEEEEQTTNNKRQKGKSPKPKSNTRSSRSLQSTPDTLRRSAREK